MKSFPIFSAALATWLACAALTAAAETRTDLATRESVERVVLPVMQKYKIAGMAVALTVHGTHQVYNFGEASLATHAAVDDATLFEIGSVSKTFTATLAALAQEQQRLSLDASVGAYAPMLAEDPIGKVKLSDLGTHSAGGFPLQLPDGIGNDTQLVDYFRQWRPAYAAGTHRTYANPSVGLLGWIAAQRLGTDFATAEKTRILDPLGLEHTFLAVPAEKRDDYAQGYNRQDQPVRMNGDRLSDETYGIKTTASDLVRFVEAQLGTVPVDPAMRRAIEVTHEGRLQVGPMTQDLVWEQYGCPATLPRLLDGSTGPTATDTVAARRIEPPAAPRRDALLVKSGSTNGFGAFVAMVPGAEEGVVILANRNYPLDQRVEIAWKLLTQLGSPYDDPSGRRHAACLVPAKTAGTGRPSHTRKRVVH